MSRRQPLLRGLRLAVVLGGVLLLALFLYGGLQARHAQNALNQTADRIDDMVGHLEGGRTDLARQDLARAQESADKARDSAHGPSWWLSRRLPGVGTNVDALSTMSSVADEVTRNVLPPLLEISPALAPAKLFPPGGGRDLAALGKVAAVLAKGDAAFDTQADRLKDVRTTSLNRRFAQPVERMRDRLRQVGEVVSSASRAAALVPDLMGAHGGRRYLLMVQDNSELRATGGVPRTFAVLTASGGRLSITSAGGADQVGAHKPGVAPLTAEERALFQPELAELPQDVNLTPDFPRSAQLLTAMWSQSTGQRFDGVVSVDPVALSYLLRGTGPVTLAGGQQLDADHLVDRLLHENYVEHAGARAQQAQLDQAVQAVLGAVSSGQGEPDAVLAGLVRGVTEGRVLVWSAHQDEQKQLSEGRISGSLPTKPAEAPVMGLFLNDGTGGRLDYYLDYQADVKPVSCADGQQRLRVTLTMASKAPGDAATSLPRAVLGPGFGAPTGTIRTTVHAYAPVGGEFRSVRLDSDAAPAADYTHHGRTVSATSVDIDPGRTRTLTYDVETGPHQPLGIDLRVTPGARSSGVGKIGAPLC